MGFLINRSARNHRKQHVDPDSEFENTKENIKTRQNRSRSPSRVHSSGDAAKYSEEETDNEKSVNETDYAKPVEDTDYEKSVLVSSWSGEEYETDDNNLSGVSKEIVADTDEQIFHQVKDELDDL